ncbi:hypothetical protein SAMN04488092_1106 [Thalassovita taeanensis]|uniref:Uncharacterized protein n=1 Tax=Thalassovita taeanensis TaxID=657014 RepID=A0A1H9HNL0_9RHOB|nr:hypothetical protein SAMN04488092_1106 [Thalassovita taeanensis]
MMRVRLRRAGRGGLSAPHIDTLAGFQCSPREYFHQKEAGGRP